MSKKSKKRSEERCKQSMSDKHSMGGKNNKGNKHNKSRKHSMKSKHQASKSINPDKQTLDEIVSMPTGSIVEMLLNHNNGFFADFAYQYNTMMEVYDLIEQYDMVRATCMSSLTSNLDAVGILNGEDSILLDEQVVEIVLQSAKTRDFKHLQTVAKKAPPTMKKLDRAIQLLEVAFKNHPEMDDSQKSFIKGIMLDSRAALLEKFNFVFNPNEEVGSNG